MTNLSFFFSIEMISSMDLLGFSLVCAEFPMRICVSDLRCSLWHNLDFRQLRPNNKPKNKGFTSWTAAVVWAVAAIIKPQLDRGGCVTGTRLWAWKHLGGRCGWRVCATTGGSTSAGEWLMVVAAWLLSGYKGRWWLV